VLASNQITVLNAYGSLFFAGARNLEEDLPQVEDTHNAVVILSLRGHTELGSTFIGVLERYVQALRGQGNTLMLVSVSPGVYEQLQETEFLTVMGAENVFVASTPGESTARAYQKAQELIQAAPTQPEEIDKPL
jgi:SulP family sulfate permease